jgi:hypothetical protein
MGEASRTGFGVQLWVDGGDGLLADRGWAVARKFSR